MAGRTRLSPTAHSIFAILDGLLLFFAMEGAFYAVAFLVLHRSFDTPTVAYLTSNLAWAVLSALAAGYTAGRVAGRSPVLHGVILSLPLFALAIHNLAKGIGGRRTAFVLIYNLCVPLAVVLGAYLSRGAVCRHDSPGPPQL